ncbi:MAG: sigma-70 family RNA polymerase sigma factor [Planctomycetota bacterium]
MSTSTAGSEVADLLLPRVAAGDESAVQETLDRFGGLVWSLARRLCRTDSEAEDAVQDIFVDVWQSSHRYDAGVASETAFVAMIARRRLIDRRRKAGRRPQEVALTEGVSGRAGAGFESPASVDDSATKSEETAEARRAMAMLSELSEEQQRVLQLSIYHGLSHEKIARATGLPLGTVKTHARRGLIRIRELLSGQRLASGGKR